MQREYRILCRMQRSRSVHFRILRKSVCCSEVQAEPFRLSVQLQEQAELLQQALAELLQREQAERLPEYRISCRMQRSRSVHFRILRRSVYCSEVQAEPLRVSVQLRVRAELLQREQARERQISCCSFP